MGATGTGFQVSIDIYMACAPDRGGIRDLTETSWSADNNMLDCLTTRVFLRSSLKSWRGLLRLRHRMGRLVIDRGPKLVNPGNARSRFTAASSCEAALARSIRAEHPFLTR